MKETIQMRGQMTMQLSDRAGRIVDERRYRNRIVTSGRRLVAEFFSGDFAGPAPTAVSHMAVGTGSTAPSDADADLEAQRGNRNPISSVSVTEVTEAVGAAQPVGNLPTGRAIAGSIQRVRVTLQTVFDFGEANDPGVPLREAGIFTADSGGVMYNRVVFEPVTKTDAFRLTLFWDIDF